MSAVTAQPGYASWAKIPKLPAGVREVVLREGRELLRVRRVGAHVEVVLYVRNTRGERNPAVLRYATRRGELAMAVRHAIGDAEISVDAETVVTYIRSTSWGAEL